MFTSSSSELSKLVLDALSSQFSISIILSKIDSSAFEGKSAVGKFTELVRLSLCDEEDMPGLFMPGLFLGSELTVLVVSISVRVVSSNSCSETCGGSSSDVGSARGNCGLKRRSVMNFSKLIHTWLTKKMISSSLLFTEIKISTFWPFEVWWLGPKLKSSKVEKFHSLKVQNFNQTFQKKS